MDIRKDVAWALGEIGDPSAKSSLQQFLVGEGQGMRLVAAEALRKIRK